jgi:penicillin-insensitive murein endopeptidase
VQRWVRSVSGALPIRSAQGWLGISLLLASVHCGSTPARPPASTSERSASPSAAVASSTLATAPPVSEQAHASQPRDAAAATSATSSAAAPNDAGVTRGAVPDAVAVLALDGSRSTSVGSPSHGSLIGGVALPDEGPGFIHNKERPDNARYGTVELLQTIIKAAAVVERELPGSGLVVNDLGLERGGPIHQHGSHESGRDADILFYSLDQNGKPAPSLGVPIEPDGTGWDFKDLATPADDEQVRLDARRTWRFVQALLEEGGEQVQRIFLVEHVRSMLLEQAQRVHAPQKLRERFADLTCQPEQPHDDHMHVRLFCTPQDIGQGCWDKPPIYPWHRQALHALGLHAVLEPATGRAAQREEPAPRTTSRAQAKKRAGKMHVNVRRFLERRETWAKKPSPGRLYCP